MTRDELVAALREALADRAEIRFALLFGSAATRGPERARDVDLAIAFARPVSLLERGRLAVELEQVAGLPVDLVDLDEASTLLRWEVTRVAIEVAARDRDALVSFLARVPFEYDDLRPFRERAAAGLRARLKRDP